MLVVKYFPEDNDTFGNPDMFREMFRASGDWYTGEDEDPYAVFIVVYTGDSDDNPVYEQDAMKCSLEGLLALFSLYGRDDEASPRLEQWCSCRIRKIVKRAHGKKWRKLLSFMEETPIPAILVSDVECEASVVVFAPMRRAEQPKTLKSLQVSGLDLGSDGVSRGEAEGGVLQIVLDKDVHLSTGKAIAQAGHALQLAVRNLSDDDYALWKNQAGYAFDVRRAKADPAQHYPVEVTDAGFTEIAPGTKTALAYIT